MVNPHEDYEQDKIKGNSNQTVIIDERETGETDALDPRFSDPDASSEDPEANPGTHDSDVERNDEDKSSLEDPGLNRDADDDLSLNKPQDDIF